MCAAMHMRSPSISYEGGSTPASSSARGTRTAAQPAATAAHTGWLLGKTVRPTLSPIAMTGTTRKGPATRDAAAMDTAPKVATSARRTCQRCVGSAVITAPATAAPTQTRTGATWRRPIQTQSTSGSSMLTIEIAE